MWIRYDSAVGFGSRSPPSPAPIHSRLSPGHVNWTRSGIIEPKPRRLEDYAGRRKVAQLVVCNRRAYCILLVSTDDHWVASPVPGQAAKTDKVIPEFEF